MPARFTFDHLAVALLFLAIFAAACLMPAQNDTWWHLRVGQEMWKSRWPLYTDTFSFTVPGAPFRNHEWLTQLAFYAIYSIGGMPLLTFAAAVLVTVAWVLSWSLMAGPAKWRVLLVGVALPANAVQWSIRPQLVTLLVLPLVMGCLLRRRLRWIPPIFMAWANLHAGFMLGLIVLAVASAVMVMQDRSQWRALTATLGLSALATFVNPLGIGLWTTVFESIGRGASIGISEFRSAQLLAPEDLPFWILGLLLAGLVVRRGRQLLMDPAWPLVATSLVLIPASFRYGRNIPLFLLLAVPAITRLLVTQVHGANIARRVRREHPALNVAVLVTFAAVAGSGVAYAWQLPLNRLQWEPLSGGAINAVAGCPGELYNRYDDGGFLIWFVPSRRVFVDSRQDPYPLEFLHEHLRSENSGDYAEIFARYRIHCAFLPPASPVARNLLRDGWLPVYQDSSWVVVRDVDLR
jgi:hypothetical protein